VGSFVEIGRGVGVQVVAGTGDVDGSVDAGDLACVACVVSAPRTHGGMPAIFDSVVRPALEVLGDLRPLVPQFGLFFDNDAIFFIGPVSFLYSGVQMVRPAFTALFSGPSVQRIGDRSPVGQTVLFHQILELFVLFCTSLETT